MEHVEKRKGDWIQTYSGVQFYPLDPRPGDIVLADIIHSLSNQCRYGGHALAFYSVAEHSALLATWIYEKTRDPHLAMAGLMHDAAEAYILDIPRPIKQMLPDYIAIEKNLEKMIFDHFGISDKHLAEIKQWDTAILMDERRVLFKKAIPWGTDCEPLGVQLRCLRPDDAAAFFAVIFAALRLKMMGEQTL